MLYEGNVDRKRETDRAVHGDLLVHSFDQILKSLLKMDYLLQTCSTLTNLAHLLGCGGGDFNDGVLVYKRL